jgi:hypothetical protein
MKFLDYLFRKEAMAKAHIADALTAHLIYELEHGVRQGERTHGKGPSHELHMDARRHGLYDKQQARTAVFQRVVRAYHAEGRKPPKRILAWLDEAMNADS